MKRMKRLSVCMVMIVLLASCGKDDPAPAYTDATGKWTYTTPDAKIKVDFEITKDASGTATVSGLTLVVDGTSVVPVTIVDGVSLPDIASMRFSANDAGLVYPYSITFTTAVVSADFTQITASDAAYTFPWGTTKNLSAITIARP